MNLHLHKPSRPSKIRHALRVLFGLLVCGILGFGVYRAYPPIASWYNARQSVPLSTSTPLASFTIPIPPRSGTINLLDPTGATIGTAERLRNDDATAVIKVSFASLPPIDPPLSFTYEVWMLKDGLADVLHVGSLAPRADGTWFLSFPLTPQAGFLDPDSYSTVVVTREPNDGNPLPSRDEVTRAQW